MRTHTMQSKFVSFNACKATFYTLCYMYVHDVLISFFFLGEALWLSALSATKLLLISI